MNLVRLRRPEMNIEHHDRHADTAINHQRKSLIFEIEPNKGFSTVE